MWLENARLPCCGTRQPCGCGLATRAGLLGKPGAQSKTGGMGQIVMQITATDD